MRSWTARASAQTSCANRTASSGRSAPAAIGARLCKRLAGQLQRGGEPLWDPAPKATGAAGFGLLEHERTFRDVVERILELAAHRLGAGLEPFHVREKTRQLPVELVVALRKLLRQPDCTGLVQRM